MKAMRVLPLVIVMARRRDSARVIVLDERGDVLLVRVVDSLDDKPPVWITPGGGIELGETIAEAAARELREETGLEVTATDLGTPVAVTRGDWVYRGEPLFSEDWFFIHRTTRYEPDVAGQEELEAEIHDSWRWWTIEELEIATEMVLPGGLTSLLRYASEIAPFGEVAELPWVVPQRGCPST